jgi:hypothetical protein
MQKQRICCSTFLLRNHDAANFFCFQPRHSKPGAFITQIVAKTAFARGRTANVNASAVSGQTVMLTKTGQRKAVSAYDADDTNKTKGRQ